MDKIKNLKKIVFLVIISTVLYLVGNIPSVSAASFSITSGISSTTVGKSYTISISAKGLTGKFNISHSSNVSVNVSSVWVDNGVADTTIKVTTKSAGTATVTVIPDDVSDSNTGEAVSLSSKTDTVTVKSKSSQSNSGNSSSGNSSSGANGSNSSTSSSSKKKEDDKPTFSSVNETVYANDSVNVRSSYSTSSTLLGSLKKGDSITRTGRGDNGWSKVSYNGQTAYIKSSFLTTEKPEESNNKALKSLIVAEYKLTPDFSSDVTEYSLTVGADVESLDIEAVAEDDASKVKITGNDNLLMGENTVEITVTAEDGTVRTYSINVTKGEENPLGLSELKIEGYSLNPEFSTDIHEYILDIADTSVTSLNVQAVANIENAEVEIVGNTELKLGENIITILVKSDNNEIATYQIIVNITDPAEEQIIAEIDNNDLFLYGGIAVGAIILLIIIIVVIIKRRHNNNNDDPYYGGFTSMNNIDNKKDKLSGTGERSGLDDSFSNSNIDTKQEMPKAAEMSSDDNDAKTKRKSVIEENFGADIDAKNLNFDDGEDNNKKRGKHF